MTEQTRAMWDRQRHVLHNLLRRRHGWRWGSNVTERPSADTDRHNGALRRSLRELETLLGSERLLGCPANDNEPRASGEKAV